MNPKIYICLFVNLQVIFKRYYLKMLVVEGYNRNTLVLVQLFYRCAEALLMLAIMSNLQLEPCTATPAYTLPLATTHNNNKQPFDSNNLNG